MECIACNGATYTLGDGRLRCKVCRKTFSPKRIAHVERLIEAFCSDLTAHQASQTLELSYPTVCHTYQKLRTLVSHYCEAQYQHNRAQPWEYEEYLYIEASKRHRREAIFESHTILTFGQGDQVYTLLMPSLVQYKTALIDSNLQEVYHKEMATFMRTSKIRKITRHDTIMQHFWHYFEAFMLPYKGISEAYFASYLKEAEFKFNTPQKHRATIVKKLYFEHVEKC
ncbi:MAG: hypothetical protein KU37_02445 [Sulfuricurvum sp. PC08-66]|nr:MAG: hypothetical protein KU37_02445 [Sulfuricurvum sp. PC08-66]